MDTQKIDWTQGLEAVHIDGRVVPAKYDSALDTRGHSISFDNGTNTHSWCVGFDGKVMVLDEWTIRNVAPKEVEWGPALWTGGEKPTWLKDGELFKVWLASGGQGDGPHDGHHWDQIREIVLPANHPHYATPTRTALEQRMEDFVRRVAMLNLQAASLTGTPAWNVGKEAAELRAELPEPVDPILLEARQVVADQYGNNVPHLREQALSGDGDEWFHTKVAIAALSRGRALERGE